MVRAAARQFADGKDLALVGILPCNAPVEIEAVTAEICRRVVNAFSDLVKNCTLLHR